MVFRGLDKLVVSRVLNMKEKKKAVGEQLFRDSKYVLWFIILLAVVLRICCLSHQLPYRSYIEEDEFIYTALKYGTGDFNPHWFFHPPLYSYLLFVLYTLYYLLGSLAGWYSGAEDFAFQYVVDPSGFYIIARCLSVFLVIPTLLLLYELARKIYSTRCALVSCVFFAVMPLDVWYSHFGCSEPLLILFTLISALFAAKAMYTGASRNFMLAGLFAGFTVGTKYLGLFTTGFLLVAAFSPRGCTRWKVLLKIFFGVSIGFLVVCPFPVLAPREYFANIALLLSQPLQVGEYPWVRVPSLYLCMVDRYVPEGMGVGLGFASLAGIVFLWARHRRADIFVAVVPTMFYLIIGGSRLYYDRYMLICYPFFAIAAASLLEAVAFRVSRRSGLILVIFCFVLACPSLFLSIRRVSVLMLPETSIVAAEWISDNLPRGTSILVDIAPVQRSVESLQREQDMKIRSPRQGYGYRESSDLFFRLQQEAARGRKGFDVTPILHPRGFHMGKGGRGYEQEWMTPELMKQQLGELDKYDYVLLSSHKALRYSEREKLPPRFRFLHDFYRAVEKRGRLVKTFSAKKGEIKGDTFRLYKII
jgi:4-amino-4-deoxy-L-arabinose transferase-like glycosyltransferase